MTDTVQAAPADTSTNQDAPSIGNQPVTDPASVIDAATSRLFKVKVDGSEREVDENELLRGYSHAQAAAEKMRQASETRQLAEQVLQVFKTNPKEAFAKLGVDAKAFAEQVLREEMEESILTPEQKEMRDLKRFKEEVSKKEETAREEQARLAEEAFRETIAQDLQKSIITSLESADLPRNEFTVSRMAFYLESCIQAGFNATPQDVVAHVKQEYDRELKTFLASVPEDKLLSFIGDDFTKKVVKAHINKTGAKKKAPAPAPAGVKIESPPAKQESLRDFFRKR